MATHALLNDPVTTMFTDRVKPDKTADYDAWSAGINGEVKQFSGFIKCGCDTAERNQLPGIHHFGEI